MFKKLVSFIITTIMVLAMVGCSSNQGTSAGDEKYPKEKILIGVELYDPTEAETLEFKKYLDQIAKTYNFEFKYSEAIADADAEMKFIEDCASAGAKGFVAYYNITGVEQAKAVMGYDMYYWGGDENIYPEIKDEPYYAGFITAGNYEYEAGKAIGEWVVKNGFKKVVYAAGGAAFGIPMFIDRQKGFTDGLGNSGVEVVTVNGFPGDQFFADQAAALATEGIEAVCASFNGVDFWAQPIATAGLSGKVKLATLGSVNESFLEAFEAGKVDLVCAKNIQTFGLSATMISNAIDGNKANLDTDGSATYIAAPGWTIDNAEDFKKIYDVQNEGIFTMDDITSYCKAVNSDATYSTLNDLVQNATLENLLKR